MAAWPESIIMHAFRVMSVVLALGAMDGRSLGQCPMYSLQTVGGPLCPPLPQEGAIGFGLSEAGMVVGMFDDCNGDEHPFTWFGTGPVQPITMPGYLPNGVATDANIAGTVVGYMTNSTSTSPPHAFVANSGVAVDLGLLPDANTAEAHAINSLGHVVGFMNNTLTGPMRAFRWQSGMINELALPIGPNAVAHGLNDTGAVCGWMGEVPALTFSARAFIWQNGITINLGVPAVAYSSVALAINNLGDACGYTVWPSGDPKTFLRRACAWFNGQYIDLGVIPGELHSRAEDINDAREIVGTCWGGSNGNPLMPAFIWRNGTLTSLGALAPSNAPWLAAAHAINNAGQIAGECEPPGPSSFAFLLTPALPATPGDTDCSGHVNVLDLLAVILNWNPPGPVGGNPADLNRDNRINVSDLLLVINNWS